MENNNYKTIIIGGGASGICAAIYASEKGSCLVLERNNKPCKKVYASGNGRCNYLNTNAEDFEILKSELEKIGIIGTEEEGGRMYPRCKEASFVAESLVFAAKNKGAEILCDTHVSDIVKTASGFKIISKDGRKFECENLIIACGGKAGIQFGCYGEGYKWAQSLGHKLVKPIPALVGMECSEEITDLHGVRTLADITLLENGQSAASEEGEVQFTKDSISGICVMNLSRYVRLSEDREFKLIMNLLPEYSSDDLEGLLTKLSKIGEDAVCALLPEKLCSYIKKKYPEDYKNPSRLAKLLSCLEFNITGTKGWADAQVTSGGVPISELNTKNFESLLVSGLYFAGEIVDYDGPCGGYNLAFAFRSGMLAGKGIK